MFFESDHTSNRDAGFASIFSSTGRIGGMNFLKFSVSYGFLEEDGTASIDPYNSTLTNKWFTVILINQRLLQPL